MPATSWSLTLCAPWRYYKQQIIESLAKWCQMCDANQATKDEMRRGYPSLFRKLRLVDFDSTISLTIQLNDFFSELEQLLPGEYQECMIYALMLIERGFKHRLFVHSVTVKR